MEQSVGATPEDISKSIKSKFVSMVERHYLQRVKQPHSEVTVASHGAQEMGGVVKMPVFGRFDLPATLNGRDIVIRTFCKVLQISKNSDMFFQILGIQERSGKEMIMERRIVVINHCPNELSGM